MKRPAYILGALCAALSPGLAFAGADSDTMTVTATVIDSCEINAQDMAFGDYDPVSATPLDAEADVTVRCTNGTGYEVAIDEGAGAGATVNARRMLSGSDVLTYSLYRNIGRTNVWGETSGANTSSGTGSGGVQTLTVYGRISAQQSAPAGDYTDTVTVQVTY